MIIYYMILELQVEITGPLKTGQLPTFIQGDKSQVLLMHYLKTAFYISHGLKKN